MKLNFDYNLWDTFLKGDDYSLSLIYNQHVQQLYRYGKKFSKDDELIQDTIQDLFYDLIRTREKLSSTDNIRFYLLVSFRRKLVQSAKKYKTLPLMTGGKALEAEIIYSVEKEMMEKEELSERERMLQEGLKVLSPKQREILYYRYTCDFSYEQICEIMSLNYDSARKQMFRALKSLRQILGNKENVLLFLLFCH